MKKIVIVAVLLLALLTGLALATGRVFTGQVDEVLARWTAEPGVSLLTNRLNEGWLSSSGDASVSIPLDANMSLELAFDWQARHFPGWVNYTGEAQVWLIQGGQRINLMETWALPSIPFSGRAGFSEASLMAELEAIEFADKDWSLLTSPIHLTGIYEYQGAGSGQLTAPRIEVATLGFDPMQLVLHETRMDWQQAGDYPWVKSEVGLSLASLEFSQPQSHFSLHAPQLVQKLDMSQQQFDLDWQLDSGQLLSDGQELGSMQLGMRFEQVPGQPMVDLMALVGNQPGMDFDNPVALNQVLGHLSEALAGSPQVHLTTLDVKLVSPFEIEQSMTGQVRFNGEGVSSGYLQALSEGQISDQDFMNRLSGELRLEKVDASLLMMLGIPPFMLGEGAQHLTWENGQLRLNGQRLPF